MYFKLFALAGLLTIQAVAAAIHSGDELIPSGSIENDDGTDSYDPTDGYTDLNVDSDFVEDDSAPLSKRDHETSLGWGDCAICSFGRCTAAAKEFCHDLANLQKQQGQYDPDADEPKPKPKKPNKHGDHYAPKPGKPTKHGPLKQHASTPPHPIGKRASDSEVDDIDSNHDDFNADQAHAFNKRGDDKEGRAKHPASWYLDLGHIKHAVEAATKRCEKDPESCPRPSAVPLRARERDTLDNANRKREAPSSCSKRAKAALEGTYCKFCPGQNYSKCGKKGKQKCRNYIKAQLPEGLKDTLGYQGCLDDTNDDYPPGLDAARKEKLDEIQRRRKATINEKVHKRDADDPLHLKARDHPKASGGLAFAALPDDILDWFKHGKSSGAGSAMHVDDKHSRKHSLAREQIHTLPKRDIEEKDSYGDHRQDNANRHGERKHHHHQHHQHHHRPKQYSTSTEMSASEWHNPLATVPTQLPIVVGYGP